ncbi:hypothetical protein LI177_13510 [bacterium 210820-DFI.6.37]|nr:hypothetical protein [bacterium 210820-DFI.6.37]
MLYNFNYAKLVNALCAKGFSSSQVAEILGIPERLYLLKLCNQEEFSMDEIRVLSEQILELSPDAISEYFFCPQS